MTLEALLTFIGVLIAVLAIVRPVQRHSLTLFVPMWGLGAAICLALVLIICRDAPFGVRPLFGWSLAKVVFGLTISSFLIPVGAALWGWISWHRAKLTGRKVGRVENVFTAALREREFDEVERIVRKNHDRLEELPASATSVLFNPAMVAALVNSHSLVHLELLANMKFLRSLENRYGAVDVVVRELLRSDLSSLRSAVVSKYGGLEHLAYSESERALMKKTFQNHEWYFEASAHYPLVISAVEALRSGRLDTDYNGIGRDYEASQGISARSHCPIYLSIKTEVLAIEAALQKRSEKDFYVSDLRDIFGKVQERSKFNKSVWQDSLSNREFPTPYAYLLYAITEDLRHLSAKALEVATSKDDPRRAENPGRLARDLALTWSYCISSIADSEDQVGPEFRIHLIEQYLLFVLALGWEPNEIYFGAGGDNVKELHVWRDLWLSELQARFVSANSRQREALKKALESLDHGKRFVFEGYTWLEQNLFGKPPTS